MRIQRTLSVGNGLLGSAGAARMHDVDRSSRSAKVKRMSLGIPTPLAVGRFKRLPQRAGEVWQGDIVRLPMWVEHQTDPDGPPFRPIGVLWASVRTGLVHLEMANGDEPAIADLSLATFLEFGLKWAKGLDGRPARVEVRNASVRDALAGPLATLDTRVELAADLPAVRAALHNLEIDATGERLPGLLESPGMSVERLRAFASAAAAFFVARPWDQLTNEDLLLVEGGGAPRTCVTSPCSDGEASSSASRSSTRGPRSSVCSAGPVPDARPRARMG